MNHRRILGGIYLLTGLYLTAELVMTGRELVEALSDFFAETSAIYAIVASVIIFLVPVFCFVLAFMLNSNMRNISMILLAIYIAGFFPIAALPFVYFLWLYFREKTVFVKT